MGCPRLPYPEENRSSLFVSASNFDGERKSSGKNYETFFRQYDPALGRMTGIDPMAVKYSGLSPYNYAFNDPVGLNDPSGADPYGEHGSLSYYYDANPNYRRQGYPMIPVDGGRSGMRNPLSGIGDWGAGLRSAAANYGLMSTAGFNSFYGIDDMSDSEKDRFARANGSVLSVNLHSVSDGNGSITSIGMGASYDAWLINGSLTGITAAGKAYLYSDFSAFGDQSWSLQIKSNGSFLSGFGKGVGGGVMSTWNLLSNDLWTGGFWLDQAQMGLDMMTGKALFDAAEGAADFAQKVPNMSSYELGYATGFGVEKAVEAALVTKGAGMARGALSVRGVNSLGTNPFRGKTFSQIDEMFKAKGFTTKGPSPSAGKGSYFNPKTGTRYYLDKGGMYKKGYEGPHVDIWYNGHPTFKKVKYFLDNSPKMYTPN